MAVPKFFEFFEAFLKALQDGETPEIPTPVEPTPQPTPQPTPTPAPSSNTTYRVQVGVFRKTGTRDNLVKNIKKKTGFDCFSEKVNGQYYVYCGSFQNKSTANQRVNQLKAKGFSAFVKVVKI